MNFHGLKLFAVLSLALVSELLYSQSKEYKCKEVYDAVKLIDEGNYEQAITILRKCEKTDSKDYTYPYEIALAYSYQKEYQKAVNELERARTKPNLKADYFQLLGNNYDYLGQSDKAMQVYDEGLQRFPNAGRLYLEKGVVYEGKKKILDAIKSYEMGISVDPQYPSNYFRAAKLYLDSSDKLSGLIYGEIFLNLERTTQRSQKMSELLYNTYKNAITFQNKNEIKINFCEVIIDEQKFKKNQRMPLCAVFGKNFILGSVHQTKFDLASLSEMRSAFLKNYNQEDVRKYPNVLFNYWNILDKAGHFNTYNRYIFQVGSPQEFAKWNEDNTDTFQKFADWYTNEKNYLHVTTQNVYISDSIKE